MITNKSLQPAIGQRVTWKSRGLSFEGDVIDARAAYGRIGILVSNVTVAGEQWLDAKSCETVKPSVEQPKETPP